MPATILFVHGTGVRSPGYGEALKRIDDAFAARSPRLTVAPCCWGDTLGSRLNDNGASIPQDGVRALGADVTDDDRMIALWAMLNDDPLFEIRLIAGTRSEAASVFGNASHPDVLQRPLGDAPSAVALKALLDGIGAAQDYEEARRWVLLQPESSEAVTGAQDAKETADTLARAIVARMREQQVARRAADSVTTDPDVRDLLVRSISELITPGARFLGKLGKLVAKPLTGLALRMGTNYFRDHRMDISEVASPGAGDILLYQAFGDEIRNYILDRLHALPSPVVALGHSLGGIALVDLLMAGQAPNVKLLVTAGSQSPYFYEINALHSNRHQKVPPDQRLPAGFPRWLNFYDLRDFLSYVAAPIFGSRAVDIPVDNRSPFPQSHGGYFSNRDFYDRVHLEAKAL